MDSVLFHATFRLMSVLTVTAFTMVNNKRSPNVKMPLSRVNAPFKNNEPKICALSEILVIIN